MKNNVYIIDTNIFEYKNISFNPSEKYPEGLNLEVNSDEKIYDNIRKLFITMELDKKNIGKKSWNPFGEFIKKGDKVVIKPNFVNHINPAKDGTTDSLITNFAIIRPIIDYCIIALNGTGSIIVGDAPVQDCNFEEICKINDLKKCINIYNDFGHDIKLIDFRKNNNSNLECKIVSIGKDSSLSEVDKYCKKYAITNYNLKYMHEHHSNGKHEYMIPKDVLEADVIINLPKPKTHRKAGMTACMKNFVGINSKKEYLPHHRNGSIHNNGDEFPEKSLVKSLQSTLKNYNYLNNKIIYLGNGVLHFIMKKKKQNRFLEGSWYGNDTIWRTILDINKIILYSNKEGIMTNKKQRVIFNLADMIVSGEKEGPLLPSNKNVGLLVASFNQLNMDHTICKIMGFDTEKIKYIKEGYKLKKYKISDNDVFNIKDYKKNIVDVSLYNKSFIPTDGWIDYLGVNTKK